jgi:hypothetical protein
MTKQDLKKLIKQVLNENQTDRESMVDKIAAEIRAWPIYKNVTTSKFGQNVVGYFTNGYKITFIVEAPNKIRVQLHNEGGEFVAEKTFNTLEKVIAASKNPIMVMG